MRALWMIPLVVVLAACASAGCPTLAPDLRYCLRPPATGPRLATLQEVVVESEARRDTLLVRVENDGERLVAVAVSPLGQTLVAGQWDGSTLQRGMAAPQQLLDAGSLLASVQLAMWPFDVLRSAFRDDLIDVTDARNEPATLRVRHRDGRTLLELERNGRTAPFARTRLRLPERAVILHSRTLDESEPAPAPSP